MPGYNASADTDVHALLDALLWNFQEEIGRRDDLWRATSDLISKDHSPAFIRSGLPICQHSGARGLLENGNTPTLRTQDGQSL
jgi:hypothetical protein